MDARGITTSFAYDALNRQINRSFTGINSAIESVETHYDGNNNPILSRETYSLGNINTSTQHFDDFDRLEQRTAPYGRSLAYGYDLNGNRTQLTDPDNLTTSYLYDALNRITTVNNTSGSTQYTYDKSSLVTQIDYPNDTHSVMVYDNAIRTMSITHTLGASGIISAFSYLYDVNGNRQQQSEQNGTGIEITTYLSLGDIYGYSILVKALFSILINSNPHQA